MKLTLLYMYDMVGKIAALCTLITNAKIGMHLLDMQSHLTHIQTSSQTLTDPGCSSSVGWRWEGQERGRWEALKYSRLDCCGADPPSNLSL